MIGLDTNVLVRYIVRDDPAQTDAATRLIESRCTVEARGFVSLIVLAELVWVLSRGYRYGKPIIIKVLRKIMAASELMVEEPPLVWAALSDYEQGKADFPDYLIARRNQAAGCDHTFSFDLKTQKHPLFAVPP